MTVLKKFNLKDIYTPIEEDLESFSSRLKNELDSEDTLIRTIHEHLLRTSGKFLRPALALFSSRLEGHSNESVIKLAVAIELIHTATLVHDDIIDDSTLRRNQPTVYSKWGREISIVAGDYLYAKAFMLLASLQDNRISEAFSRCAHIMCEGEMKQIERRNFFEMTEAEYLRIIHQKTASLFQAACMGGSYLSGANLARSEKIARYGYHLGMAFQIADDCLDIAGDSENLGKTTGLDFSKNDVTLPMLYLVQSLSAPDKKALLDRMAKNSDTALFDSIRTMAIESKAIDKALEKAQNFGEKALSELECFPASAEKESLVNLVHHCVERNR